MNLTILHVEDDPLIADAVAELLASEGWRVESCADGLTALALIQSPAHYDLIILDNGLPYLDGLELTRRTRQTTHRSQTPILMLSRHRTQHRSTPRRNRPLPPQTTRRGLANPSRPSLNHRGRGT